MGRGSGLALRWGVSVLGVVGRVGPGCALIDESGRLRYRTFDSGPATHEPEIL